MIWSGVPQVGRGRGIHRGEWDPGRGRAARNHGRGEEGREPGKGEEEGVKMSLFSPKSRGAGPSDQQDSFDFSKVKESLPDFAEEVVLNHLPLEMSTEDKQMYGKLNLALQNTGDTFQRILAEFLSKSVDPWYTVLCWAVNSADFKTGKPRGFTGTVIYEFEKLAMYRQLAAPRTAVQDQAFVSFSKQKNSSVMKNAFRVFRLTSDRYKGRVIKMVEKGEYKEACDCATGLQLFGQFHIDLFIKPLLLNDKINCAEEYLTQSPGQAVQLIQYLDSLGEQGQNLERVSDLCKRYPLVVRQECAKLRGKTLDRLIKRLAELFNVSADNYPGLADRLAKADLRHWVHNRYNDSDLEVGLQNWRDLMVKKVGTSWEMKNELVNLLLMYDPEEAKYWANNLNVKKHLLEEKQQVEEDWENDTTLENTPIEKNWATSGASGHQDVEEKCNTEAFHQLALTNITFVDTVVKFVEFIDAMKGVSEVGMDAESSPDHVSPTVSLLQIATKSAVFLLDMEILPSVLDDSHWSLLRTSVFSDPKVKILGYGVSGDIKMLAKTSPQLSDLTFATKSVINLDMLKPKLNQMLKLPFSSNKKGLSGFTEMVLGKPLLKVDQIADWSKRPLRPSQIVYAALDAYVAVEIFLELEKLATDQGQLEKYQKILKDFVNETKEKKPEKIVARQVTPKIVVPKDFVPLNKDPISPGDLRVVCSNMLQGLCKKLRLLGVDALAIENGQDHMDAVPLAVDGRYVLSKGNVAARLSKQLPKDTVLPIIAETLDDQIEEVFRYFNVVASEEDVFSRCVVCNGGRYLVLPKSVMLDLKALKVKVTATVSHFPADDFDDCEEDNFGDFEDNDFDDDPRVYRDEPSATRWVSVEGGRVNMLTGETEGGVMVGLDNVPSHTIEKWEEFWVCDTCGKVYWQGSHWAKAQDRLRPVLSVID